MASEKQGSEYSVFLGIDGAGDPIALDFEASPHVLVVGGAGQGKTTALRLLVARLLNVQGDVFVDVIVAGSERSNTWSAVRAAVASHEVRGVSVAFDPARWVQMIEDVAETYRYAVENEGDLAGLRSRLLVIDDFRRVEAALRGDAAGRAALEALSQVLIDGGEHRHFVLVASHGPIPGGLRFGNVLALGPLPKTSWLALFGAGPRREIYAARGDGVLYRRGRDRYPVAVRVDHLPDTRPALLREIHKGESRGGDNTFA